MSRVLESAEYWRVRVHPLDCVASEPLFTASTSRVVNAVKLMAFSFAKLHCEAECRDSLSK